MPKKRKIKFKYWDNHGIYFYLYDKDGDKIYGSERLFTRCI